MSADGKNVFLDGNIYLKLYL